MKRFMDRTDAGRQLAEEVARRGFGGSDTIVLGLPRGGVVTAAPVAARVGSPLDVIVVRKLGVPWQPELAMGAIGEEGVRTVDDDVVRRAAVSLEDLAAMEEAERGELERRAQYFRNIRPREDIGGRTALIVDDGIATGSTARAACRVARALGARRVVLAVPVAPAESLRRLADEADEVICLQTPEPFFAIGEFYLRFEQTSNDEVTRILHLAGGRSSGLESVRVMPRDEDVELEIGRSRLAGHLNVTDDAHGLVIFAHGSGSSRHSPRNRFVAEELNRQKLGTLLFDLLTTDEELDRANVFDIPMLGERLAQVTDWARAQPGLDKIAIGYFGASTGAGAALWAAAQRTDISAVVSRGGRPDMASERLPAVKAPTLLIVGGRDHTVEVLNREAQAQMRRESRLEIVPGATHLFEEPGTLAEVARQAGDWFLRHMTEKPVVEEVA
jgi:putative phosphoribosyl transferase